jgi:hypothetical protein
VGLYNTAHRFQGPIALATLTTLGVLSVAFFIGALTWACAARAVGQVTQRHSPVGRERRRGGRDRATAATAMLTSVALTEVIVPRAEKARDAAIKSLEQAAVRGTSTGRRTPQS